MIRCNFCQGGWTQKYHEHESDHSLMCICLTNQMNEEVISFVFRFGYFDSLVYSIDIVFVRTASHYCMITLVRFSFL